MTGKTSLTSHEQISAPRADGIVSREGLAAAIEEQILTGRLSPGAKLPSERQLAEHHGLSRPVVREALRSLVERNLVEIHPGRGAFVRRARLSDAAGRLDALYRRTQATPRDVVEARTMVESTAAALAAERASDDDLAAMDAALSRFERSGHILDQARCDLAFHLAIARAAHNPVVETIFGSITGLAVELMLRSLGDPEVSRVSVPYHRRIAEAIRAREPEQARALMREHLAVADSLYGEDYDRNIESVAQRELRRLFSPAATLDDLLAATIGDETAGRRDGGTAGSSPD